MGESDPIDSATRIKPVQVLARAAYDEEFYKKLRANLKGTLNDEGIPGDEFNLSDDNGRVLENLILILKGTGLVIFKRH